MHGPLLTHRFLRILAIAPALGMITFACSPEPSAEDKVVALLGEDAPYHLVSEELFAGLGWELPDGGAAVSELAMAAPGGALDPRDLEAIAGDTLGYTARWHEVRFNTYGLDWDITGLHLTPSGPVPDLESQDAGPHAQGII